MLRVLVLDDEDLVLRSVVRILRIPGLDVTTCVEIEAARALLTCFEFDVLVTDLQVSALGGLEGMRLIRFVGTHFPRTKVFVHSGHIDAEVRRLGDTLGVAAYFEKPLGMQELRTRLAAEVAELPSEHRRDDPRATDVPALMDYLATDDITAAVQPIVRLDGPTDAPVMHAVETLARGPQGHPLANPSLLFAYATSKENLFEVDLRCAAAGLAEARNLPEQVTVFINVNPRSLSHPDFEGSLLAATREHGRTPQDVVLEMTEQAGILNSRAFGATLARLREHGYRVALDDFGEGHSNLHVLRELRPEYLKLSGLLCQGIATDHVAQEIVRSQAEMARRLDIRTIIEFVEDEEQATMVRELGVELAQGYHYARPSAATDFAEWALDGPT